jgi:hypothetical protein
MQTIKLLCALLLVFIGSARAQIGATKEEVYARHLDSQSDFAFAFNPSDDGHVIFERWYSETYHSAKVALNQIEPAYLWKEHPAGSGNWFGAAPDKPSLHALYYQSRTACHLFIASLADAPDKGQGGYELWDYSAQLKDLRDYYAGELVQESPAWPTPYSTPVQETPAWPTPKSSNRLDP